MQNPLNVHKDPYTYAQATQRAKAVHKRTQKPYTNVRKIHTTYTKPQIFSQTVCYRRFPSNQQVDLKRHGNQRKRQVPTN